MLLLIVCLCGAFTIRSDLAAGPGHRGAGCGPAGRGEVARLCGMFDGEQMAAATGQPGCPCLRRSTRWSQQDPISFTPSLHETPHRGRTHTPLLGVRGPVPGRKAALLVCCHVPDRVSHGLTPLGFETSQFRVAPTDALIQNPPSTRGRSLAGRHHGSDDVRIQDQRPSARSARCTAAWAS
jgi:hypothetical protein